METNTNLSVEAKLAINSAISLLMQMSSLEKDISKLIIANADILYSKIPGDLVAMSDNFTDCRRICLCILDLIVCNDSNSIES